MHVIKRSALSDSGTFVRDASSYIDDAVRIPAARVATGTPPEQEKPAVGAQGFRVLRRSLTQAAARPYELDLRELTLAPEPKRPAPAAPSVPAEPEPDVEELLAARDAEWQARLDEAIQSAHGAGYAQGHEDAAQALGIEHEERRQAMLADLTHLTAQWRTFLDSMEPTLASLSFEIAQALLEAPLPANVKGIAARAITEAVEQMAGSAPIEILLHPVDFLRLQESGVVEQLESLHSGMRWEPRLDMKHGDWIVQCPSMAFRRIEDELLATLRSRLGLLAAVEKERPPSRSGGTTSAGA